MVKKQSSRRGGYIARADTVAHNVPKPLDKETVMDMTDESSGQAADEREALMLAAWTAKESGTQHFGAGRHARAMEEYSRAIAILFKDGDVPIIDFGLGVGGEPPALLSDIAEAVPLAVTLLTNRAAVALELDRPIRALADTRAALAFVVSVDQRAKVVYSRAEALIKVGAFDAAQAVIRPFIGQFEHRGLGQRAESGAARISNNVPMADGQPLGKDGAFLGPIAPQRLEGKGRGMVATERMEPGAMLLVESAVAYAPIHIDEDDPTLQGVILNCTTRCDGDAKRAQLLDSLQCMYPLRGEEADTVQVPYVPQLQELATMFNVPLEEVLYVDKVVLMNEHRLRTSWGDGRPQDFGCGLFPLSSLFNHSCYPNACWSPVKGGLVTFLRRRVEAGEEVTVQYLDPKTFGEERRSDLQLSYGFACTCERCAAQPGSDFYEQERASFAMTCPDGTVNHGHVLLPISPYSHTLSYACAAAGCGASLSHLEAEQHTSKVVRDIEALKRAIQDERYTEGCCMAKIAESEASKVLAPSNHIWASWAEISFQLGELAEDLPFACHALKTSESLDEPYRARVDSVYMLSRHAANLAQLSKGWDTTAIKKLKEAYRMQVAFTGNKSVKCFVLQYFPSSLHAYLHNVLRNQ